MVKTIADIKPNKSNPRRISKERQQRLGEYLSEYGDLSGLVYNSNPDCEAIISGHQRTAEFKRQKSKLLIIERYNPAQPDGTVARGFIESNNGQRFVYREVNWPKEKADEATIIANGQFGEWDSDKLANEWQFDIPELMEFGVPDFVFGGIGEDDQGGVPNNSLNSEAKEDDYEVPEIETVKTDIKRGDVFEIGPHRLMCGDSTDKENVELLLGKEKPFLMVTDPPYGVNYNADWRNHSFRADGTAIGGSSIGKVTNDDTSDWEKSYMLSPSSVAYVWHCGISSGVVQRGLENEGFDIRSQIVWVKSHFAISRGHYHVMHETCFYAVKKGNSANFIGDRKQTTAWHIQKPQKNETGHSTQKPIECMHTPIRNHEGDVYDPFLGSGTTMVTAHQLGRRCFGMEIDPKYCQVIINRMRSLDPDIEIKRNGEPYL